MQLFTTKVTDTHNNKGGIFKANATDASTVKTAIGIIIIATELFSRLYQGKILTDLSEYKELLIRVP